MRHHATAFGIALLASLSACGGSALTLTTSPPPPPSEPSSEPPPTVTNPLLMPWEGPYGGVPPFGKVQVTHFKPAMEEAMALSLAEVERIANQSDPATFDNTLAALERANRTYDRVRTVYGVWAGAKQIPEFQEVEREMGPKIAAFSDKVTQNQALFQRITVVYETRDKANLTPEQKRLAWKYYDQFVRAGAKLDPPAKARMAEINQKLASLYTSFSQSVIADETDQFVLIEKQEDLAGLPEPLRQSAATEAESRNMGGKWVIANTRSAVSPFLTYSERRELREKVWRMFVNRGDGGGTTDTKPVIKEILKLRGERAKLLGYETHAHWRIENTMAKTPERALELLEQVWKPAVARSRQEVKDMQALADKEKAKIRIEPWDYRYYAEKVRKQKYDLDENLIKPYMQLHKLRDGMFWVAGELFGLRFKPMDGIEVFHPDVTVWQVSDSGGKTVGLFYFDPYARKGKRSGAWMNAYRVQEKLDGEVIPIISNNANFMKGVPGQPMLISWDDATTLFHEFGHALHGLLSNVHYPSLAGTAVVRDYVEFPSQLLEHWLSTPEVLKRFAVHHQTGESIPQDLVERIERASTFNQGFDTVEFLGSAFIDMKIHLAKADEVDPQSFEKETLAALGMPSEIVMRHRTPQFMHIFSSDSYSAGYYSYLWADVLVADGFEAFREAGGPYDKKVAESLRVHVLSVGNTVDPSEGYRSFRGRDARVEALMKKRGFSGSK